MNRSDVAPFNVCAEKLVAISYPSEVNPTVVVRSRPRVQAFEPFFSFSSSNSFAASMNSSIVHVPEQNAFVVDVFLNNGIVSLYAGKHSACSFGIGRGCEPGWPGITACFASLFYCFIVIPIFRNEF